MNTLTTTTTSSPYRVDLLECPSLDASERAAAELRFRMALEAALGGTDYVLPSLQAYMLALSLEEENDEAAEDGDEAVEQMLALWETAEAQAIVAAMKPLGDDHSTAQFQIVPL